MKKKYIRFSRVYYLKKANTEDIDEALNNETSARLVSCQLFTAPPQLLVVFEKEIITNKKYNPIENE